MSPDHLRSHLQSAHTRLCRRLGQPVVPHRETTELLNEIDALNRKLDRWAAHYHVLSRIGDPCHRNNPRMVLDREFQFLHPGEWVRPPPRAEPRSLGGVS